MTGKPPLSIYVVWHPEFGGGRRIHGALFDHYRRDLFANVLGGQGVEVFARSEAPPGAEVPLPIDLEASTTTAICVLIDSRLTDPNATPDWRNYVEGLVAQAKAAANFSTMVFPIAIDSTAYGINGKIRSLNFIRWERWSGDPFELAFLRLRLQLTYQLCKMLRAHLIGIAKASNDDVLNDYLQKLRVFLSHSKHDAFGETIAKAIRNFINDETDLEGFFDVLNIPPGVDFADVLVQRVRNSAMVAIQTDSYASREWCRREVLVAKSYSVAMVVANCVTDFEERCFPYLGNVPALRMDPSDQTRIGAIVARLLDEVLKHYLWQVRTLEASQTADAPIFLPRQPELINMARLLRDKTVGDTIVYPDPPLGEEETEFLAAVGSGFTMKSFSQWLTDQKA